MMTIARRASRPIPIMRVWATCRVPFGLMPLTAAIAAMITARASQTSQFMIPCRYKTRAISRGTMMYQGRGAAMNSLWNDDGYAEDFAAGSVPCPATRSRSGAA